VTVELIFPFFGFNDHKQVDSSRTSFRLTSPTKADQNFFSEGKARIIADEGPAVRELDAYAPTTGPL
jgi:hypothetical protein